MADAKPRLSGALRIEAAEWIWEQLQEEGYFVSGELVDLILDTERALDIQGEALDAIAKQLEAEFEAQGISSAPTKIEAPLIRIVLSWEDEFLGLAGIRRAES